MACALVSFLIVEGSRNDMEGLVNMVFLVKCLNAAILDLGLDLAIKSTLTAISARGACFGNQS